MYLIISWFYSLGKISGIVPEPKLKNWIFQRDPGRDSPYGFSFSVFQFFCFSVLLTELFRNISGDISEYLRRNWKTEKLNFPERSRKRFSIWIQFFSFSVFLFFSFSVLFTELFRKISADISEYLRRNWKTEKLKNWIFQKNPGRDSPYGFSFSVFLFFSFSVLLTELFQKISADISEYLRRNSKTEKLKNRKTEKLNFPERSRKRFSIWIQFFSFSVFLFCGRIGQEELDNCILRVSSLHVM